MTLYGNNPFGAHKDVLDAPIPTEEAAKLRLLEELKNRGRSAVQAGHWPDAHVLYEKALQVAGGSNDKAILNSNDALVLGKMNKWSESKQAAERAVELDSSYTKGFWRLGQAAGALGEFEKAVKALKQATKLEPNNKALQKELKNMEIKAKQAAEQKVRDEEEAEKKKTNDAENQSPITSTTTKTTTTTVQEKKATTTSETSSSEPMEVDNVDGTTFSKSEHVKGYKIVNGKKTSYFHNELSEEAKQLIGDIAPKKLDPTTTANNEQATQQSSAAGGGTAVEKSAWNKAGTWEERDITPWACDSLKSQLEKVRYTFPNSSPAPGAVVATKKATITGHASVATVRGKKRYFYELICKLEWSFDHEDVDANGILNFPDVDGTCPVGEGYDAMNFEVSHATNDSMRPMLEQFVHRQGWRNAIHDSIDDWVRLFKETY